MTVKTLTIACLTGLALIATAHGAHAASAMATALDNGATRLAADQIAERLVGRTGTWVSASGKKKIAIYYGKDNDIHATMVGGGWTGTGYYAIADDDSVCVSWDGKDKGRLRCLDVLIVDGRVTKFNADGSLNGTYEDFETGKSF